MTHKPLKVAVAKIVFSSVYVIGTTCFDECFSFHDNWKTLLLIKIYRFTEVFVTAMLILSLKPVF